MQIQQSRPDRAGESRTYPGTTEKASRGREQNASAMDIGPTLRRLRRELLQKILDRENERRVARSFAAY